MKPSMIAEIIMTIMSVVLHKSCEELLQLLETAYTIGFPMVEAIGKWKAGNSR